jgi:hypothetical protein
MGEPDGVSVSANALRRLALPFRVMSEHPYRTAWRTRDLDAWSRDLAPDVVLYSPILTQPFQGRDAAVELFGVLFTALGGLEITHEFADGDSHAFFWRVQTGGRTVEGVDLLRSDETGKICEIRVLIRPLPDIATFAAAIGPPLAAKRGPIRGPLARAMISPLRAVLAISDWVAARLIQSR